MVKKAGLNYGLTLRTIISHDCPGDPFFQVATCVSCHRMNEAGNEFGPDLTKLHPKQAPADLLCNILEPSAKINDKYYAYLFEMESGRV